jgi:hypothetical protein
MPTASPPEPSVTDPAAPAQEGNDAPMKAAILAVAITGAVLALGALAGYGARAAIGVAVGGVLATLNLLVFARIGQAFVSQRGNSAPWALIAVVKLIALLGGVWLILKSGYVSGLALTIGYGALPIGITMGSLFGPKPPETTPPGGTSNRRAGDVLEANAANAPNAPNAKDAPDPNQDSKRA